MSHAVPIGAHDLCAVLALVAEDTGPRSCQGDITT